MRKYIKNNILEIFQTMFEAHRNIKNFIDKRDFMNAQMVLGDCQNTAVQIGIAIEKSEGEGYVSVVFLEEYCEAVYDIATSISDEQNGIKAQKYLDKKLIKAENSVKNDIKVKLEIVFTPYKVSMWDSLESVWKAANDDPNCNAYVIPIPYFDRNPDGSFGKMHYEGTEFPEYVPITHYEKYNFELMRPDVIYYHNSYDAANYVTSVAPQFYSRELKKYTDKLVYIPYFVFPKKPVEHLINENAIMNADCIIVQNQEVKNAYIEKIKSIYGMYSGKPLLYALGSPKIDKIYNLKMKSQNSSNKWKRQAQGKKIMFMNTNVSLILNNGSSFIDNMRRIFTILKEQSDNIFVIWREHPLSEATIKSMRNDLDKDYKKIKAEFLALGIGEFDFAPEAHEAMIASDCYFGSGGSLIPVYAISGKPMMVTDYHYPNGISNSDISLERFLKWSSTHMYVNETHRNSLALFLDNITELSSYAPKRLEFAKQLLNCVDGTVGQQIHEQVISQSSSTN